MTFNRYGEPTRGKIKHYRDINRRRVVLHIVNQGGITFVARWWRNTWGTWTSKYRKANFSWYAGYWTVEKSVWERLKKKKGYTWEEIRDKFSSIATRKVDIQDL